MELTYWWIPVIGLLGLIAVVVVAGARKGQSSPTLVAHGDRLSRLPAYQAALRAQRTWFIVAIVGALLMLGGTVFAAARPAEKSTTRPEQNNRDVMLCLDSSGSMSRADATIVSVFQDLSRKFDGERIGLVIFDSSSVQVFPLTDDYDFIEEQLGEAQDAFNGKKGTFNFFDGTWEGEGSSLIGDGLASCVQSFPKLDEEKRSRSIILATDNLLSGQPLVSLQEAGDLARQKGIRVYGLNPADITVSARRESAAAELKRISELTGGGYFPLERASAVNGIVTGIQATEKTKIQGSPQVITTDHPQWPLGIAFLGLSLLLVAQWRLRR
ncbi:vWA domain-containing protein [Pseudarthrobacter sp. J1738]|uniref:vWA domain-containing protein n=1 Tax=Pseudarthrobacter sp. J1738 TaxID=3420446 RepID=UPI003D2853C9